MSEERDTTTEAGRDPLARAARRAPTRRLLIGVAVAAGVIDGFAVRNSAGSAGRTILSAVFMAAFVYVGLRFVTALRFKYRPADVAPDTRDPSAPPPPGGWATPTSGQRARRRLGRLFEPTKPGPRRR